jgi:hypothetical protein
MFGIQLIILMSITYAKENVEHVNKLLTTSIFCRIGVLTLS